MKHKCLKVFAVLACLTLSAGMVACGGKDGHTHTYDTTYDETHHWEQCQDSTCNQQDERFEHDFEWVVDEQPTISETGLQHEVCSDCGYTRNENTVVDKLPHDCQWGTEYQSNDTHHWLVCEVENCGEKNESTHNFEWKESQLPTCTEVGWEAYQECADCDYNTKVEIPASHNLYNVVSQEPTCTQAGWEAYQACYNCDYNTKVEIPAAHDLYDVNAQEPTCTQVGWAAYQACHNCDYNTKVEIPEQHDVIDHVGKEASCTEVGWEAYQTCGKCDYSTYEEIPMEEHDYQNRVCFVCGARQASEGLKFTSTYIDEPVYEVSLGTCTDTEVVIPSEYNGKPVAKIAIRGFENSAITSITIPASIRQMGGYGGAFTNCTSLFEVNFLGTIDQWASINFGEYFTNNPLYLAGKLYIKSELVKHAELAVPYVEDLAFNKCTSLESVTLLNGVEEVGQNAFAECSSLETVTIAPSVKKFSYNVFKDTISIKTVNYTGTVDDWVQISFVTVESNPLYKTGAKLYINDKLVEEVTITATEIASFAFYTYEWLKSVTIAKTVTAIEGGAFNTCSALETVRYEGTVEEWNNNVELTYRWVYKAPVTSVTCSDGSVAIPNYA